MKRVITLYPDWDKIGGAQKIALQLAIELNKGNSAKPIIVCESVDTVIDYYKDQNVQFVNNSLKTFLSLRNDDIILSHHRKITSLYIIYGKLFFRHNRIIHVAHNTFTNLKFLTFLPTEIVAVSNGVKENLINYFKISSLRISVIFNGMKDCYFHKNEFLYKKDIKILLAARICPIKQQVELVKYMKGRVPEFVSFYFAGDGEDSDLLKSTINGDNQFHMLGNIDMMNTLYDYDYVCLFSKKEGLGLSLIEGCMFAKPLITNSLPAVLDVNIEGINGFVFSDFEDFLENIFLLPQPCTKEYKRMSSNSRIRYEKFFTEEEMYNKYRYLISYK